jgi:hypothetical protein
MNSPYDNGVIRQQDIRDRNIARQRIAAAIEKEAQRTGILVDLAISLINENPHQLYALDAVWKALQTDAALSHVRTHLDDNVSDYPGFAPWVNGSRRRIEDAQKNRLRSALRQPEYRYRFANTVGFRPAFA